ncbi:MAG: hypothetical protein KBG48_20835 [Kofleriaceae bacterium]|nr:hypothetical protein [Kofleriaceae bacterium]MBP9169862.1 hypothetical protein [Kofleriaceae bacterium]MBP9858047.1 hypothetical protein [Kofleriaceae bacterium]
MARCLLAVAPELHDPEFRFSSYGQFFGDSNVKLHLDFANFELQLLRVGLTCQLLEVFSQLFDYLAEADGIVWGGRHGHRTMGTDWWTRVNTALRARRPWPGFEPLN